MAVDMVPVGIVGAEGRNALEVAAVSVLGRQATSRSQARAKELAELRLQVLVVVIASDACESKKEIILKSDLQSEGLRGVLLVLISPMTTPRLS